ncbi:MAG: lactate utilization protein C [Betaproteobacteria bacterium]|nr:MAG: lactate utilization protein C [Betaproteobacteria bacterium]
MSEARDRILAAVRLGLGRKVPLPAAQADVERAYIAEHRPGPRPRSDWEPVQRFRERALALASSVDQVATMAAVPGAVAAYLASQSLPPNAVVWPALASLDWRSAGVAAEARRPEGRDLVGITGSFCAIAETGTLLLVSGPSTPPSASLLPETHIAIVACSRIVRTMEDAWALARAELGELPRAANFVSGPSRTADIEQTLVLGAHGPYRVHIVLLDVA